jgi:hypothetical protein
MPTVSSPSERASVATTTLIVVVNVADDDAEARTVVFLQRFVQQR